MFLVLRSGALAGDDAGGSGFSAAPFSRSRGSGVKVIVAFLSLKPTPLLDLQSGGNFNSVLSPGLKLLQGFNNGIHCVCPAFHLDHLPL